MKLFTRHFTLKVTAFCKTKRKESRKCWMTEGKACRGLSKSLCLLWCCLTLDVLAVEAKYRHFISLLGCSTIKTEDSFTLQTHLGTCLSEWNERYQTNWWSCYKFYFSIPVIINHKIFSFLGEFSFSRSQSLLFSYMTMPLIFVIKVIEGLSDTVLEFSWRKGKKRYLNRPELHFAVDESSCRIVSKCFWFVWLIKWVQVQFRLDKHK